MLLARGWWCVIMRGEIRASALAGRMYVTPWAGKQKLHPMEGFTCVELGKVLLLWQEVLLSAGLLPGMPPTEFRLHR